MTKNILLAYSRSQTVKTFEVALPSSKSESNRALIINALCDQESKLDNLSTARDTQTMIRLLASKEKQLDVIDAGTTMRFLAAYLAATNQHKILTGTARMCDRPIGILVDALRQVGAEIEYLKKDGFPPIEIRGIKNQKTKKVAIPGNVSSQYISALLMIAPLLPNGFELNITGQVSSKPYINMTLNLMSHFGVTHAKKGNEITIRSQKYTPADFTIESDWSAASYWYSIFALADDMQEMYLPNLKKDSRQGDQAVATLAKQFGVTSTYDEGGVTLTKSSVRIIFFKADFTHYPDLAQTMIVLCAAKGIKGEFTGLESLKIKETDRTLALQTELKKIGANFHQVSAGSWALEAGATMKERITFETYDDHRMAMALAPLAVLADITIENPEVVNKSYPSFWEELGKAGLLDKKH